MTSIPTPDLDVDAPRKRRRTKCVTLSLSDPSTVAPYFLEELPHLWSVQGFCNAEFNRDHRSRGDALCGLFLKSMRYIRDTDEVSQIIRNIANNLAMTKRSFIKRVWQQCYDDMIAQQAETRLKKRQGAQQNFEEAAALPSTLNQQLEGGPFDNTVLSDSSNGQNDEKTPFTSLILGDSSGSEYNPESEKDQDNTVSTVGAFEKPPEKFNWLVGPGDSSSRLKTGMLWKVKDVNISQNLAERRSETMLALELLVDPDLLALRNFIYTPKVLQDVMSVDDWTEALESWQLGYECNKDEVELVHVVSFACNMHTRTTLNQAITQIRRMNTTNPLHSIIENHLRTSVLWGRTTDVPGQLRQVNEDTFINDYVKPVMDGLFGDFINCTMHWARDELQCGPCYVNEEKLYPDFFLSIKGHTVAIMEAKAPNRGITGYMDDRRKLYDQMKLAVDGLLSSGIDTSVVGFLVSGQRVEVFAMSLRYEACYLLVDIGEFDLVTSRYQFGNILTAARPLLTARNITMEALGKLRIMNVTSAKPIHTELRRGTTYAPFDSEVSEGLLTIWFTRLSKTRQKLRFQNLLGTMLT
ncbi:hypothetical protein EDD11_009026 [Mortierella claussenii]|nr:hypothetical protein EDD11_009026 [Mortierella claussenii]